MCYDDQTYRQVKAAEQEDKQKIKKGKKKETKEKKRKKIKPDIIKHDADAGGMGVMASRQLVVRNLCSRNRRALIPA